MFSTGFLSGNVSRAELEQAVTGENLLIYSSKKDVIFPYGNASLTVTENVSVPEWGATDAINVKGINTTSYILGTIRNSVVGKWTVGKQYTISLYIKNNSDTVAVIIEANGFGISNTISPKETKKIVIHGITSIISDKQMVVKTASSNASVDFTFWHPKFEEGIVLSPIYTPSPTEQFLRGVGDIPEMHRNIFRGKNLGTVFTDEQKANIKNGTFHDLWLGDYWTINNHTWRIVDINYWYNKGDTNCTTNHIVVMPDAILYSHKMNNDNVTTDGYHGSLMYTEGLTEAKNIVNTDFGEGFVLNHRVLLTNKVDSGHASAGTWYDSTVELANEIMMYGCLVFSAMNNGTAVPYSYTTEYTQLALFRLVPRFINASRQWFWLRDVVSAALFAYVHDGGNPNCDYASYVGGVRPVVGITGGTVAEDKAGDDLEVTDFTDRGYSDDDLETASLSTKGGDPL